MRKLDENKRYYLSELNDQELTSFLYCLSGYSTAIITYGRSFLDEIILHNNGIKFYKNNGEWGECENNNLTNAKELFYTFENIQVDCSNESEERIKQMAEVFEKHGIKKWDNKNAFLITNKTDCYLCLSIDNNDCFLNYKDEGKYTITYDKFMELFGSEEKTDFEKLESEIKAIEPKQYQIGIDTFERCESNMTKEENKADRYNNGKLKWSLVDFDALEDMVKVLEFGAKKYSADNWKKGLYTKEIVESLIRHLQKYLKGEDLDLESNLPHTGHILCNAMFLSYMMNFNKKFDNRIKESNKFCCGNWDEKGECKCK